MQLRFWGTRGSMAKPGPDTVRYGGNTSCIQVESAAGTLVMLDCGTGAHGLGAMLLAEYPKPLNGHILISHTHWDHIQGIPFFAPLFIPGNKWGFYAPRGFGESLKETLAGQMQYTYFPVTLDSLGAEVQYHHLVEGSFRVGDIRVRTRYLNHPALTLGFRMEVDGAVVVYACDHEPHSRERALEPGEITGQDQAHAEFMRGADLVIHDAQYTASEYPDKVGWGHSTVEYAVQVCRSVGVKRLALTHHDPMRDDDAVDRMMESLLAGLDDDGPDIEVFAAAEGQVIELSGVDTEPAVEIEAEDSALRQHVACQDQTVLLGTTDSREAELIAEAANDDNIELTRFADGEASLDRYRSKRPSLVILDRDTPGAGGLELCRSIRALGDEHAREVPIILVAPDAGADADVTDWLVTPFSTEYARTRIRAWLLRVECRWARPPVADDEPQRVAALQQLNLLDTEPEERFDRITRLASALFDAPISLVTLVDAEHQWFKSCVGTCEQKSNRDVSFCAHAILNKDPLVVPDALLDDRFADNPVVTGPPHVRFYAGCPLYLPNGYCMGTLCVIDVRARQLSARQLQLLRDLAAVVERELGVSGPA